MDSLDKQLLTALQYRFPLTARPFLSLARTIGSDEKKVIHRIKELKAAGIIRQISAIFDSAKIGYTSTLAAFRAEPAHIEKVAGMLSELPGFSHNYQRVGNFNLWFTLTLPSQKNMKKEIASLANKSGIKEWLYLPSIRQFKISFRLPMGGRKADRSNGMIPPVKKSATQKINKQFIVELQKDIPICSRPFRASARHLGCTETKLLERMQEYIDSGAARRFAAVLRQRAAGFPANVMVAWAPNENQKEPLGRYGAGLPLVSHCYERPVSKKWPYSIYTMIHGKTEAACRRVIQDIVQKTGVKNFCALKTVREFKKQRVQYYTRSS